MGTNHDNRNGVCGYIGALYFLNGKINSCIKKPFGTWLFGKIGILVNRFEVSQNCSAFLVLVSLVRGKSERFERKFETEKSR